MFMGLQEFEGFTSNPFQEYFFKNIYNYIFVCWREYFVSLFMLGKLILMDV